MAIEINPNRVGISSGGAGKAAAERRRQQATSGSSIYTAPRRSDVNYIPGSESLMTLINSAVEALRGGVYWDRGTILNLVV